MAAVGVGEAGVGGGVGGEVAPTLPVAWGCSSKGLKLERMFSLSGDLHFERGAQRTRGGLSSVPEQHNESPSLQIHHPGPHLQFTLTGMYPAALRL